jgi:hypothetical protein
LTALPSRAFENGERVRRREWSFETPRELG